jgi:hypothetical protein
MRLNEGLPVWHASVSLQQRSRWMDRPAEAERYALEACRGVGGDREWWFWNPAAHVGHLRVSVTPEEAAMIPPGLAVHDAGESGPERARTLP